MRKIILAWLFVCCAMAAAWQVNAQLVGNAVFKTGKNCLGAFDPVSLVGAQGGFWRADLISDGLSPGVQVNNPNTANGASVVRWGDSGPNNSGGNLNALTAVGIGPYYNNNGMGATGIVDAFPYSGSGRASVGFGSAFPLYGFGTGTELRNTSFTFASTTMSNFALIQMYHLNGSGFARFGAIFANGAANDFTLPSVSSNSGSGLQYVPAVGNAFSITGAVPQMVGSVADGVNQHSYLNGVEQGSPSAFSSTIGSNPNGLYLGNTPTNGPANFSVSYWLISNHAMTPTEITNLKNWTNCVWGTSF